MSWFRRSGLKWAILALSIVAVFAFLWVVPEREVAQKDVPREKRLSDEKRVALVNEYRRTWAQILGGAALLGGLYFTWRTVQVNREGQITERFTRAIDQLGAADETTGKPKLEIRLGGIYALERIARDSPDRDHSTVMEVLTAYVRQNAPLSQSKTMQPTTLPITDHIKKALLDVRERLSEAIMKWSTPSEEQDTETISPAPRTDVQAILTVLGRSKQRGEDPIPELDLRQTDLQGAHLLGDLRGIRLYKAGLRGAHLFRARLQGADLQEANLQEANLQGANLEGANCREANLQEADLRATDLQRANLFGADLRGANLQGTDLRGANLQEANLRGAKPRGANLQEANLQGANLQGARLRGADLQEADLRGADLQVASLLGANLQQANLRDTNLRQVEKGTLDQEQISRAYGDEGTTLPESLQRPKAWGNSPDDQTDGD